jgi:hypothetical protein
MISLRTAQKWRLSMLERYYIRPDTIDRIRASWIAGAIERYVDWLTEHRYAPRNVFRRVPILRDFGDFARARDAAAWEQLPAHVDALVEARVRERGQGCRTERARRNSASVRGARVASSNTSIERRQASSCEELISPRYSPCRCSTRPPLTRVFSTTLK